MPREEFTTINIGLSVVLTLVMLLTIFLSSEGVKGYNKKFSIVLLVCAAFQIIRIFYYPLMGVTKNLFVASPVKNGGMDYIGYFGWYPSFTDPKSTVFFILMLVYLITSAACLIGSAVWGFIVANRLEKFQKQIDNGEISIEDTIKAMDKEDEAVAAQTEAVNTAVPEEAAVQEVVTDKNPSSEVE